MILQVFFLFDRDLFAVFIHFTNFINHSQNVIDMRIKQEQNCDDHWYDNNRCEALVTIL